MFALRPCESWKLAVVLVLAHIQLFAKDPLPKKADPRIQFIQNKNQWRQPVLYKASSSMADIFLLPDRIQFLVRQETTDVPKSGRQASARIFEHAPHHGNWVTSQLYETTFEGSSMPVVVSEDAAVTSYNYFLGNDRSKWGSKARGFGTVYYRGLYSGVDLKIYSENDRLKQDWLIASGGDPAAIRINYNGAESILVSDNKLVIQTRAGEVTEMEPYAWQEINGVKVNVPCRYLLKGTQLSFALPDGYDTSLALVIDPILVFSGYSGSTYDNWGNSATYDERGNLYSGGMITRMYGGQDFPATPGAYKTTFIGGQWDIGILKYDSSGSSLLYATYVGGNGTEAPQSLVTNKKGELLILGATSSTDFPVTNGSVFKGGTDVDPIAGTEYIGGSDIYVAKLSADGSSLLNATYLGGSANDGLNFISGSMWTGVYTQSPLARNYGDEQRGDIITDDDGFVYFASTTLSSDFPVVNGDPTASFHGGILDAVLVKLTPDLSSIVWNRMIGGSGADASYSIKLDSSNGVYIAGGTTSTDFNGMNGLHPTFQGTADGFVAHVSANGQQIIAATYLGTPAYDQAYFIDLDTHSDVFVYGQTKGKYPVLGTVYSNPNSGQFLHKLSADLSTSLLSTVIGSGSQSPNISPTAFLVSECNTIYLSGWGGRLNNGLVFNGVDYVPNLYVGGTTSNMPITPNAYQPNTLGEDFYFMVLSVDFKQFLYGTYLGGSASETHVDGGTSRFDKRGVVYHSVCAGCGGVSDFPAVNVPPARQFNRSPNCNNAAFKFDLSLLKAAIQTNSLHLDLPGLTQICLYDSIVYQNPSVGGKIFRWDLGDGTRLVKNDTSLIIHHYKKAGNYTIKLVALDDGTCRGIDSTYTQITVRTPLGKPGPDQTICVGTSAKLTSSNGVSYRWKNSDGSALSSDASVSVSPPDSAFYVVKITDVNSCVSIDTVKVGVIQTIPFSMDIKRVFDCQHRPTVEVKNLTKGNDEVLIDFGDGTSSASKDEVHTYQKDGTYIVRLAGSRSSCAFEEKKEVPVYTVLVPNVITPDDTKGLNDSFCVLYGAQKANIAGVSISVVIYNRWGKQVYQNANYQCDWRGDNLSAGVYFYEAVINNDVTCKSWLQIIK